MAEANAVAYGAEGMAQYDDAEDGSGLVGADSVHEDFFEGYLLARLFGINFHYFLFPGLVMHELAHYFVALLAGARVAEVVLWSPRGGHVLHTRVRGSSSVIIALAPLAIGNILAVVFLQDGFNVVRTQGLDFNTALWGFALIWLGFSFAVYSFPSKPDLRVSKAALARSFNTKLFGGNMLARISSLFVYPVLFVLHALLVLLIIPFSTNRTLRLLWGVALSAFLLSGAPGETFV